MRYQNLEIHNAADLQTQEGGGITWLRFPKSVLDQMEIDHGNACSNATGVELRFVLKGDSVRLRMRSRQPQENCKFRIYRGSVQGGWQDHEVCKSLTETPTDFIVERSRNLEKLQKISERCNYPFDPAVIRVIFDLGHVEILEIEGDIEPPTAQQLPKKTLLTYGSSITHGSNSLDQSHAWPAVVAHHLKMDCRNVGMPGSCAMEEAVAEYIAKEGEEGHWDIATLELGINVLSWEEEKARARVTNLVQTVATRNPQKPIFVISPFYCGVDFNGGTAPEMWRRVILEVVKELALSNVYLINGLELLGDVSLLSADEVHPNIYGAAQIASRLTERIRSVLTE